MNIRGYKPLANPDWISLEFDDGSESMAVHDPTGSYRAEVDEIVKRLAPMAPPDPMAGAVAGPGGGETEPFVAPPQPTANAIFTPPGGAPAPAVASPAPMPAPAPAATPAPAPAPRTVIPEAAPKGMVRAGQQRQTTGMAAEDAARVESAFGEAEKAGAAAADEDFAAKATQYWMEFGRLREDEKQKLAQRSAAQEEDRKLKERVSFHVKQMEERQARPIDGAQALAGDAGAYAFMAAFGDAVANFGAALMGQRPVADPAERINQIVERSVRLQTAQKQADYEAGRITLAQLEGERERVRSDIATYGKQLAETQEALKQTEAGYLGLGAIKKHFEAQQANARVNAAQALARQETLQDSYAPPKPATGAPTMHRGPVEEQLRAMGITKEDYTKALTAKVGQGGENAPSVAGTAQFINGLDADIAALRTLMVDGVMPNKVASNQVTDAMRSALQRFGIPLETDGSADLQEFTQRYTRRVIAEAKKMGGVITENDLKFTERVAGQSPQAILRWMTSMRDEANGQFRAAVGAHFPDYTQAVVDIMLRGQGIRGVPGLPSAEPLEVTNVEHKAPPERPKSETQTLREAPEEQKRRRDLIMGGGRPGF